MTFHEETLMTEAAAPLLEESRKLVSGLYASLRSLQLYPLENQVVQRALRDVETAAQRVLDREGILELRLAGDFVFLNDVRVRLDLSNFASFVFLRKLLHSHGIGDIEVMPGVDLREWTVFLSLLSRGSEKEKEKEKEKALVEARELLADAGVDHIALGPPGSLADTMGLSEESKEAARRTYARSVGVVKTVLTAVRLGKAVNARRIKRVVLTMVDQVLHDEAAMLGITTLRDYDEYTFAHSVNVCILSIALGQKLGFSKLQLFDLGLSALFHDIGKSRVPLEVLNKTGRLTEEEWRIMSQHPDNGLFALFDLHGFDEPPYRAMLTAYEHHMRIDFSGYPKVIRPRDLGFFPRIVAVADAYDAATSKRSYQYIPFPPDEVLRELRDNPKRGFDPLIVKAFINMMGIYPVGTLAILDSGEMGVVVAPNPNPEELHRPLMRIVSDRQGRRLSEGPVIDLSETEPGSGRPLRAIVKTTDPEKYNINIAAHVA